MILGLLLACSGEPPPTIYEVPPPVVQPPPVDDDLVRQGEVGDVFFLLRGETREEPTTLELSALFADRLEGLYPAACRWSGVLCAPGSYTPEEPVEPVDVGVGRSSWLGDTVTVGQLDLRFAVDPEGPVGGYAWSGPLDGSLPQTVDLAVQGGEWGTTTVPSAIPTPDAHSGLHPDPLFPVELGGRRFQEIRWTPTGAGQVWLGVRGGGLDQLRPVLDDGSALVDFGGARLVRPVTVELWRVRRSHRDVSGNALTVHAAAQQSWCVVDTCGDPEVPSWPAWLPFEYCWTADDCASSVWTFRPDGSWEAEGAYGGQWAYDCCSTTITMTFSSGTVYSGRIGEDGCVEGEMTSYSGNTGFWSGCF
ncbi:MAG: hypothetical protein H6734_08315 [Alphaproteobacteria bacterium]|nr:hypothetical protein [Alphaproteobacteria bacterium]